MSQRALSALAALQLILLVGAQSDLTWAQGPQIGVMLAEGESITDAEARTIQGNIQGEWNQLQERMSSMQATQSEDGGTSIPIGLLVGQQVGQAMTHAIALRPHGSTRLLGIVGQKDAPDGPSLALYDISGWLEKGRSLDSVDALTAIDVLPDAAMRQDGGRQFTVDGVAYAAAWVGNQLQIRRVGG